MKFTMSCRECIPESWQRYIVFVGCILLSMPVSLSYYFGNLLIYIYSYYFSSDSTYLVWVDPLWLSSAYQVTVPVGMVFAGLVERRFSLRVGLVAGAFLMSSSVILSYYSIVHPLVLLITFGITHGIGGGFIQSLANKLAAQCLQKTPGLAFGLMSAGQSVFCLLHGVLAFHMINPGNLTANTKGHNITYFSQTEVIEKIPGFFMKIGLVTSTLQTLGILFVLTNTEDSVSLEQLNNEMTKEIVTPEPLNNGSTTVVSEDTEIQIYETFNEEMFINNTNPHRDSCASEEDENESSALVKNGHCLPGTYSKSTTYQSAQANTETQTSGEVTSNHDLSPMEVLTSCLFWKVWLIFVLARHTMFLQMSFYKEFGLTVIGNDNMLVVAASLGSISMTFVRPLCGILADYLNFKTLLLCVFVFANVCITMLPLTLHTFPPLYIVFSVVGFCSSSMISLCLYLCPLALFGAQHYAANMGMLSSTRVFVCIIEPIILPYLIQNIGWIYVFLTGTVSSAMAVFVTLSFSFLNERKVNKSQAKN